ncbi:MAG: ribosome maturation factor RimM [Spirochaetota bacterium]
MKTMNENMKVNEEKFVTVGKLNKSFGIKGEFIAIDYFNDYLTFINFKSFYIYETIDGISKLKKYKVEKFRGSEHKIILSLEGFETKDDAERLKGCTLYSLKEDILLKENEYLSADLIGCDCFCNENKIGSIVGAVNYGTCDIFEIKLNDYKLPAESENNTSAGTFNKSDRKNNNKKKNNKKSANIINIPFYKELIEKIDIKNKSIYLNEDYKDYL